MKTTMTLSANMGCNMFDLFNQETDEVIMTINFYILLGEEEPEPEQKTTTPKYKPVAKKKTDERIRVNDATATGGWW